jgi:hypothetical protein
MFSYLSKDTRTYIKYTLHNNKCFEFLTQSCICTSHTVGLHLDHQFQKQSRHNPRVDIGFAL